MLKGKRIIITGASRGIGRAIAVACAREGAVIGVNSNLSASTAKALCDEIGSAAIPLPFDVSSAGAIRAAFDFFVQETGGIDVLVNNAGINLPALLVSATDKEVEAMLKTNLAGPILCTRAALPVMLQQHSGVVLNVSSVAAVRPVRGQAVYAASKGGIEALTRAVAAEYARKGIRCLCIRPGAIDTAMLSMARNVALPEILSRIPQNRLAAPEEVAELAVFLISDRCGYITGSVHTIDGGSAAG